MDKIMKDQLLYEWFKSLPVEEQDRLGDLAIAWVQSLPEEEQNKIYRECLTRMVERIGYTIFRIERET